MGRRKKNRKRVSAEPAPPSTAATATKPSGSSRAEVLQQAEALVARAMTHVMRIGYGDELTWPGHVARSDGFHVRIAEAAIDLATDRLSAVCEQLAREIASELYVSPEQTRTKYRVLASVSRDEPEPPGWFMPPEGHEPPKASDTAHRRRKVTPSATSDDTGSRHSVVVNDEAAHERQPIEGLH